MAKQVNSDNSLEVLCEGERYVAPAGTDITFGRSDASTIQIGADDLHMHRRAGSFRWNAGRWELHNDGAVSALDVHVDGGFTARISAGSDALVLPSDASGSVEVLTAPPRSLDFTTPAASALSTQGESGDLINEAATVGLRDLIGLTEPEIRMLVALCEPRLRNPREQSFVVPTTAEICDRR